MCGSYGGGRGGKDFEGANFRIGFGGSGLGRALLVHPARERGCGRLEWPVLDRNEPAIGFYERVDGLSLDRRSARPASIPLPGGEPPLKDSTPSRNVMLPAIMELPEGYTTRAPTREDAEVVAALISDCQIADTGVSDMSVEVLLDDWHTLDLAEDAVAVIAQNGAIASYADVFNRSFVIVSIYGYVHPDYREVGLGSYLVAWGERWTRDHTPQAQQNARVVVQHYINSANKAGRRLLENSGYTPLRGIYVMETTLDDPPPPPHWPADISVRTFVPGQDERAVYEAVEDAFRDLWGRPRNPFERFVRMTQTESFDPSLWFLATDGDEIAGLTLCKTLAGEGWVDVVGVRRPWRNRGLGLALLRHAFTEYHRRGTRKVSLSVDAESITGAPRLYGRAGMRVRESYIIHLKELRPGVDLSVRS
jgi:mycothiol synthase